jgi:hypothetical protein
MHLTGLISGSSNLPESESTTFRIKLFRQRPRGPVQLLQRVIWRSSSSVRRPFKKDQKTNKSLRNFKKERKNN